MLIYLLRKLLLRVWYEPVLNADLSDLALDSDTKRISIKKCVCECSKLPVTSVKLLCRNISLSAIESVIKQQSVNATDKQSAVIKKDICLALFFIKAKIEKIANEDCYGSKEDLTKRMAMKGERIVRLPDFKNPGKNSRGTIKYHNHQLLQADK